MINKEKLLKEIKLKSDDVDVTWVCSFIKNFPEDQEIDFDAILKQWRDFDQCSACNDNCDPAICIIDFLKSKNLTAPKPFEIPVKKTWTLKKEYQEAFKNFDFSFYRVLLFESELAARRIKYYDLHEEPDYSKIPKGSIVEIEFVGSNGNNCGYVNGITNKSISIGFHMLYNSGNSTTINFDQIESIVILKLAKE
jgi:hypothetical protein